MEICGSHNSIDRVAWSLSFVMRGKIKTLCASPASQSWGLRGTLQSESELNSARVTLPYVVNSTHLMH